MRLMSAEPGQATSSGAPLPRPRRRGPSVPCEPAPPLFDGDPPAVAHGRAALAVRRVAGGVSHRVHQLLDHQPCERRADVGRARVRGQIDGDHAVHHPRHALHDGGGVPDGAVVGVERPRDHRLDCPDERVVGGHLARLAAQPEAGPGVERVVRGDRDGLPGGPVTTEEPGEAPTATPTETPAGETVTITAYYPLDARAGFRLGREAREVPAADALVGAVET